MSTRAVSPTEPPEVVRCQRCGGRARSTPWGATVAVCYRCPDCDAGGTIAEDPAGNEVRQGPVFDYETAANGGEPA